MKSMISGLLFSVLMASTAQASDRDCTCRGETAEGKAITVVYNGRDGENSMAEAHVQIKVKGTAQKYHKNLAVYLEQASVGQKYSVRGPDFKLTLNVPAMLALGDKFTADYSYVNRFDAPVSVVLNCIATQNR